MVFSERFYYRAPEVITRWQTYNKKIDVWSIACICAELLTGEVLFKGMDHIQQVMLVTKLCGTPDEDFLNSLEPNSQNFMRQTLAHCERQNFKDYRVCYEDCRVQSAQCRGHKYRFYGYDRYFLWQILFWILKQFNALYALFQTKL